MPQQQLELSENMEQAKRLLTDPTSPHFTALIDRLFSPKQLAETIAAGQSWHPKQLSDSGGAASPAGLLEASAARARVCGALRELAERRGAVHRGLGRIVASCYRLSTFTIPRGIHEHVECLYF